MSTNIFNPSDKRVYPERWPLVRGKQLFKAVDFRSSDGSEELLSVSHITGITPRSQKNVTMFQAESLVGYKVCSVGDIAANTMWTWQGAIGVSKYNGIVSPAYNVYRQRREYYNPRFLDLLLRERSLVDVYHSLSTGIRPSRLRLYPDTFLTISFPVPSTVEQEKIVKYLDWQITRINKLISLKKKRLDFVREAIDREFRTLSTNTNKAVKLKRLCALENDFFIPSDEECYRKIGMYNKGRGIFLRELCPGNELGDSKFQRIHSGRVMLSGQFAWEDAVYVTQQKDEEGIASHRYYLLKAVDTVPVEYLFAYFLSSDGQFNLQQCSHGAAGRNRPLNINEVLNLSIPLPKDDAYKKLILLVRDYMALQIFEKNEENALRELKSTIISDVITGKLDVRDAFIPEFEYVEDISDDEEADDDEEVTELEQDE